MLPPIFHPYILLDILDTWTIVGGVQPPPPILIIIIVTTIMIVVGKGGGQEGGKPQRILFLPQPTPKPRKVTF